jgi:hypothetical protein
MTVTMALHSVLCAAPQQEEVFAFTVNSGSNRIFYIPTAAYTFDVFDNEDKYLPIAWHIDWGDGNTQDYTITSLAQFSTQVQRDGIAHTYATANKEYIISISPLPASQKYGWLRAFGRGSNATDITGSAVAASNLAKITYCDSILTPRMIFEPVDHLSNACCVYMFCLCSNLKMGPSFGFAELTGKSIGQYFAAGMFTGCTSLGKMGASFNLPQNFTSVTADFAESMFQGCTNLEMNDIFNLPPNITSVGNYFASNMFAGCTGLKMNTVFNLPGRLADGKLAFALNMFMNSTGLTLNSVFNFPPSMTTATDAFAQMMFAYCGNLKLNSVFNFPPTLKSSGIQFAYGMFISCNNLTLPSGFNFPNTMTTAGANFAYGMFQESTKVTLSSVFTFPPDLATAGGYFAGQMFYNSSEVTLGTAFNLPQKLTTVGDQFARYMFYPCKKVVMNTTFTLSKKYGTNPYYGTFYDITGTGTNGRINRTAMSIINGATTPSADTLAFWGSNPSVVWSDFASIPSNWGGN